MKKLKSNDDILDRISALPDSLILEILSFLGMRDVVKTTLLSKRWKYLWITIPCLQFKEYGKNSVQIRNFVNRALALWRGGHIRKFSISFSKSVTSSLSSDMDLWVQFATERKVEELYLYLYRNDVFYCPPQCLYECSSIRKLLLMGCDLQTGGNGNVQWNRLYCLKLSPCHFSADLINKVLSSSLQLETLSLYSIKQCKNLSIRSSSLKRLVICSLDSSNYDSSVLTIWAPNLKELFYLGKPYRNSLLTDASSLTEVDLGLGGCMPAVDGEALCQILPAINHVASVRLSEYCFEMLGVIKATNSFSPLSNVKLLRIDSDLTVFSKLVGVLEIFPKLKMLTVDWKCDKELLKFNAENYTMSEANSLKSNLSQLKTVEITWSSYDVSIFQFIEFLLTHATMIEKIMVIQGRKVKVVELEDMFEAKVVELEDMFEATQKVVSLRRSFPSVELIFYQNKVKFL